VQLDSWLTRLFQDLDVQARPSAISLGVPPAEVVGNTANTVERPLCGLGIDLLEESATRAFIDA